MPPDTFLVENSEVNHHDSIMHQIKSSNELPSWTLTKAQLLIAAVIVCTFLTLPSSPVYFKSTELGLSLLHETILDSTNGRQPLALLVHCLNVSS